MYSDIHNVNFFLILGEYQDPFHSCWSIEVLLSPQQPNEPSFSHLLFYLVGWEHVLKNILNIIYIHTVLPMFLVFGKEFFKSTFCIYLNNITLVFWKTWRQLLNDRSNNDVLILHKTSLWVVLVTGTISFPIISTIWLQKMFTS